MDAVDPLALRLTSRIVSPAVAAGRPVQVLRQFREPRCLLLLNPPDDDSRCRDVRLGSEPGRGSGPRRETARHGFDGKPGEQSTTVRAGGAESVEIGESEKAEESK